MPYPFATFMPLEMGGIRLKSKAGVQVCERLHREVRHHLHDVGERGSAGFSVRSAPGRMCRVVGGAGCGIGTAGEGGEEAEGGEAWESGQGWPLLMREHMSLTLNAPIRRNTATTSRVLQCNVIIM